MTGCTGLVHAPPHPAALQFAAIAQTNLPPETCDYHAAMALDPTDALGNNTYSNCVEAGMLRLAQMRMANAMGSSWKPNSGMAIALWRSWTNYTGTAAPGPGSDIATSQRMLATQGLSFPDIQEVDVCIPFIIDATQLPQIRRAIQRLGGVGFCLAMPDAWENADRWDVGPNLDGAWAPKNYHFVVSGCYDPETFTLLTWGLQIPLTLAGLAAYCVGCYGYLSRATWMEPTGLSPAGLDWDATRAAFA